MKMTYKDKEFNFKNNLREIIAKNIRKFRKEKGYTQEQLATYIDRSNEFIRRIETDFTRGVSLETLYRMSIVLEHDMGDFFKSDNN